MENVKPVTEPPGVLVDEKDTSVNSTETSKTIITFEKDDPENPYNWSRVRQSPNDLSKRPCINIP